MCVCVVLPAVDIARLQAHRQPEQGHQEHREAHDQPNVHATERALLVALLHLGVVFDRSVHSIVPAHVASAVGAAVLLLRRRHALAAPQLADGLLRVRHHPRPPCAMVVVMHARPAQSAQHLSRAQKTPLAHTKCAQTAHGPQPLLFPDCCSGSVLILSTQPTGKRTGRHPRTHNACQGRPCTYTAKLSLLDREEGVYCLPRVTARSERAR